MQFSDPPRRKPPETIVPMINVVFLLLIFFLMTAQIAPPDPFKINPPDVEQAGDPAEGAFTLYLGSSGELAYRDARGQAAALEALQADKAAYCAEGGCSNDLPPPPLVLRADARAPAAALAALMPRLAQAGFPEIRLVTVKR
ncbi:MAG: ExbD/TolR family protein [Pseudomonadota bacterium]|uniref:ExbD/TolR family protein n=1 Tax=Roseovarius TaxID=74030 RepID=UPI0022A843C2|nr:biopolymer transporter ExbD [Roseovarius sp. EGI FJ00037]MCZ0812885.1 biopolymer transporter ExbD [Roseovarius sp. EGI FJ00037]